MSEHRTTGPNAHAHHRDLPALWQPWAVLALVLPLLSCAHRPPPAAGRLADTAWQVMRIEGAGTLKDADATMIFDEDGRVSGNTCCSEYSCAATFPGDERISFGSMNMRYGTCVPALQDQERHFLKTVPNVRRYKFDSKYRLLLLDDKNKELMSLDRLERR